MARTGFHRVSNKSNTTGDLCGAGSAYPSVKDKLQDTKMGIYSLVKSVFFRLFINLLTGNVINYALQYVPNKYS
jgi:hypothetical protein